MIPEKILKISMVMGEFAKDYINPKAIIKLPPDPNEEIECEKFTALCGKFIIIAYDYGDGQIRCEIC